MKKILITSFLLVSMFSFAQYESSKGVLGDYNGDGKKEYAYSKVSDCSEDCSGKCETTVYFSDKKLKPFTIKNSKNGDLYNVKDLNNDGKDEIGFYPNWCTSCWQSFYVFTLRKDGFKYLVKPILTHCIQWNDDKKLPIEKVKNKKGFVKITSSITEKEEIKTVSKIVKLKN